QIRDAVPVSISDFHVFEGTWWGNRGCRFAGSERGAFPRLVFVRAILRRRRWRSSYLTCRLYGGLRRIGCRSRGAVNLFFQVALAFQLLFYCSFQLLVFLLFGLDLRIYLPVK